MRVLDVIVRRLNNRANAVHREAGRSRNPITRLRKNARADALLEAAGVVMQEAGQGQLHETTSYSPPEPTARERFVADQLNREIPDTVMIEDDGEPDRRHLP